LPGWTIWLIKQADQQTTSDVPLSILVIALKVLIHDDAVTKAYNGEVAC